MPIGVLIGIICSYCVVCVNVWEGANSAVLRNDLVVGACDGWRKMASCSPLTIDGGVTWHGFRGCVVVGVRAVQEGFPALALGEGGMQHQPRTRLRIHGTAAWRGTIFWVEAERRGTQNKTQMEFTWVNVDALAAVFYLTMITKCAKIPLNTQTSILM